MIRRLWAIFGDMSHHVLFGHQQDGKVPSTNVHVGENHTKVALETHMLEIEKLGGGTIEKRTVVDLG